MGLSDDGEDNTSERFEELCCDLNMDTGAKDEAWEEFERISHNYTLEGDKLHWLACALYVSCRTRVVPTVGSGQVVGNCVSLTRLLRSAELSLVQFFNKMKKWADMANLPADFRDKVERLERNFAVSTVIFKKYEPIFLDIFNNPGDDPPKQARGRKQKRLPCTVSDVFSFCWTVFVQVKGNFPAISDDLVNSYHLLLCCLDWIYSNALLSNRRDLINSLFPGLPENYRSRDFRPPSEPPCILQLLCEHHDGLVVEAKGIKEHWFKPYISKLFTQRVLKGKADNLSGVLELGNFEANSKAVSNQYEVFVLSVGDFDERIFLGEDANTEIGTPAKAGVAPSTSSSSESPNRLQQAKRKLEQEFETKALVPSTPLTGRRYLKEKENNVTPVSTATQSVSRLHTLLSGRKTVPSEELVELFQKCSRNPHDEIDRRVKAMGEVFCTSYAQASDDHPGSHIDFAKKRLQLGESLYYKVLEHIVKNEWAKHKDKNVDFSNLLEQDVFHRSLFACCLEIVIFSYNSQRAFPWIVEVFDLSAYHFYKVIELLIRAEENLSRDVVKHLNLIEETILEHLAWKYESPLWEAIKQQGGVPSCEEVMLPSQIEKEQVPGPNNNSLSSHIHPALRRVTAEGCQVTLPKKDASQSPTSAADRFISPSPGSARRQLFTGGSSGASSSMAGSTDCVPSAAGSASPAPAMSVHKVVAANGQQLLITMPVPQSRESPPAGSKTLSQPDNKPKKTGSLALFFRKLYHLASVRLRDLCDRLDIETCYMSQMWTCFEYCLQHHINLMQDRHLDQILMCAIYVMAKVAGCERSFQDIMRCYRLQPQAKSHVYRSVLVVNRRRRSSGDSDSSQHSSSHSGTSSPSVEDRPSEKLSMIRSSSTLPVPRPNSQPPTPTRLAGTSSNFEFETRGDIIKFYNNVFVDKIKNFALRFSAHNLDKGHEAPPLSPLPMVRPHTCSPRRRVSNNHSLYISPIKQLPSSARSYSMVYCIDRSPYKDLKKINTMISSEKKMVMKRQIQLGDDCGDEESKRARLDNNSVFVTKRLVAIQNDRLQSNGQ